MLNADACIVTNIGYPHVDLYGSIENILKDKMTIVENLREGGVAFLNYDDERIASYPVTKKVISFGIKNRSADYRAENIVNRDGTLSFDVVHGGRRVPVVLNMYGEHNVINALAAFAVGEWFEVPENQIVKALYDFKSEGIRQSVYDIGGYHLYVDCYNSAPNSMIGSIKTLCGMDYGTNSRRVVLFGDIPRLGGLVSRCIKRSRRNWWILMSISISVMAKTQNTQAMSWHSMVGRRCARWRKTNSLSSSKKTFS